MYDCAVRFYLAACPAGAVEIIKTVPPLPQFRHEFTESAGLAPAMAASADVIVAGPGLSLPELSSLAGRARPEAQLLLMREGEKRLPPEILEAAADIWPWPLDGDALRFHFSRWQKMFKREKDLQERDMFLECLLDTSPNLIWFKTKDGVHELVNREFCNTVGKTREQAQGQRHAYIWNVEADDPACVESERIVMESGKINISEEEIETGAGKRLLKTYKAPLRDFNGKMMGTMGIGVDVTMERQYLDSLLQNKAALETLFTSMDCGVLTHTLDGSHVFSVNNAALKLLGYDTLEDLEANFSMVAGTVLPEDQKLLRRAIKRLKKVGDCASFEYRVRHRDGELLYVMGNAKLVEKDGALVCQRFLLDCTPQKLAQEREEAERKRRQEDLVRALCVDFQLVFVFDAASGKGSVLQLMDSAAPCLRELFSSDAPLADKFAAYVESCVYPADRAECANVFTPETLREKLATDSIFYFTYRVLEDGAPRYCQLKAVRGASINNSFNIVVGLQSIDKRAREEIRQKNRLEEALAQARQASEAKSVFLSNMSHDIRTPMNAIAGYTALARKQLDKPEYVRGYLDKIGASCEHLISLINDILDMSHIESGKIQLDEKPWNLPELLRELWNIVSPTADAKNQTLELKLEVDNEDIYCDKLRLNQVLLNLLSNAVKYTPAGGHITMSVEQMACPWPQEAQYEFKVRDNGIGMTDEFLEKIFEPFERAVSSSTSEIQGTGLGMAITRNIVRMMNGDIKVRSKLSEGSEFAFRVPFKVCRGMERGREVEAEEAKAAQGLPPGMDSCRVLLAEDNAMNQEIAIEFLESAGYTVDVAGNGQKAVEMLAAAGPGHYDVVLMDVQMPVMGGYEATEKIRALADKNLASVPILAMTANSFEEDRQEALSRGMNGHIAKPIDFGILFGTLAKLLGRQR